MVEEQNYLMKLNYFLLSSARDLDISISYTSDIDTNYWEIYKSITWERKNVN